MRARPDEDDWRKDQRHCLVLPTKQTHKKVCMLASGFYTAACAVDTTLQSIGGIDFVHVQASNDTAADVVVGPYSAAGLASDLVVGLGSDQVVGIEFEIVVD